MLLCSASCVGPFWGLLNLLGVPGTAFSFSCGLSPALSICRWSPLSGAPTRCEALHWHSPLATTWKSQSPSRVTTAVPPKCIVNALVCASVPAQSPRIPSTWLSYSPSSLALGCVAAVASWSCFGAEGAATRRRRPSRSRRPKQKPHSPQRRRYLLPRECARACTGLCRGPLHNLNPKALRHESHSV